MSLLIGGWLSGSGIYMQLALEIYGITFWSHLLTCIYVPFSEQIIILTSNFQFCMLERLNYDKEIKCKKENLCQTN